jgi:predicted RNA-binding Zn-ribbon protein involved in translation (DUF1610 family)
MGRSYWFECPKCGYRAKISGRADRGLTFAIQTILCRDCRELYDAVTRLRVPDETGGLLGLGAWRLRGSPNRYRSNGSPPGFQAVLSRLPQTGVKRFRWVEFKIQCPVSALHHVRSWNDPDRCPKCGVYLEKSALPYRLWD